MHFYQTEGFKRGSNGVQAEAETGPFSEASGRTIAGRQMVWVR